jgi:hypothetical protein
MKGTFREYSMSASEVVRVEAAKAEDSCAVTMVGCFKSKPVLKALGCSAESAWL